MDLQTIAEGLLASIMVIGTAVIQIFLLGLLFATAFAVLAPQVERFGRND